MKYMLLIHQGDAPTPGLGEWARLSEDEQKRGATPTTRRSTRRRA